MITELTVENFKSFGPDGRPLALQPLNFIVGANASGKTNLLSALRFLKIALLNNVEMAVAKFGGGEEVRNKVQRERKKTQPVRIRLKIDATKFGKVKLRPHNTSIRQAKYFEYVVDIDLRGDDEVPMVLKEELSSQFSDENSRVLTYRMARSENQITIEDSAFGHLSPEPLPIAPQDALRLVAGASFLSPPLAMFRNFIEGWSFFNIQPNLVRQPYKEAPDLILGESGEYLAAILHKLEKQKGQRGSLEQIAEGLRGLVPGFEDIQSKSLEGKWTFQIIEDHINAIDPQSVSDGTIRLLALLVIAYGSARRSTLLAIEEPENGLHPHMARNIIELLRTASHTCQVLATTHNPDFLDELEPNEVILCDKQEGFTLVRQASEITQINTFRKHFRLGELWEQGRLGGTP